VHIVSMAGQTLAEYISELEDQRNLPETMTEACYHFLQEYSQLWSFLKFIAIMPPQIDHALQQLSQHTADLSELMVGIQQQSLDTKLIKQLGKLPKLIRNQFGIDRLLDEYNTVETESKTQLQRLLSQNKELSEVQFYRDFFEYREQLLLQLVLARSVDNFLVYIADLLALIYRTRPETLRSSESVPIELIMKHDTMDDLISTLSDMRVNELSYKGMRELSDYLRKKNGAYIV
jgi:hypothetical protein